MALKKALNAQQKLYRVCAHFSRLDEAELKTVDIHEGILSTLIILKNTTPYFITIEKHFNANGEIECFPGKLNQAIYEYYYQCHSGDKCQERKKQQ